MQPSVTTVVSRKQIFAASVLPTMCTLIAYFFFSGKRRQTSIARGRSAVMEDDRSGDHGRPFMPRHVCLYVVLCVSTGNSVTCSEVLWEIFCREEAPKNRFCCCWDGKWSLLVESVGSIHTRGAFGQKKLLLLLFQFSVPSMDDVITFTPPTPEIRVRLGVIGSPSKPRRSI